MKTLLVPIDFSPATQAVVDAAIDLSRSIGAKVILVNVVRPPVLVAEYGGVMEGAAASIAAAETAAGDLLKRWEGVLRKRKVSVQSVQLDGFPASEILKLAKKAKATMIVMGSHGHTAFYDLLIGATVSGVLRKANCPVVIVPVR